MWFYGLLPPLLWAISSVNVDPKNCLRECGAFSLVSGAKFSDGLFQMFTSFPWLDFSLDEFGFEIEITDSAVCLKRVVSFVYFECKQRTSIKPSALVK